MNDSTILSLKNPPHSIEAEQILIGGILIDENAYMNIADILHEQYFYRKEHQLIYQHIVALSTANKNIDAITLADSLSKTQQLEYIGGNEYLNNLVDATVSAGNIKSYAGIVRERYILRELITASSEIAANAYSTNGRNINIILDESEQRIFKIKELNQNNMQYGNLEVGVNRVLQCIIELSKRTDKNPITGISTHFDELDKFTSGLQRGDLIIVAGRPGMGKTSFALNITENVALKTKLPVAVFSMEMSEDQLINRLISSISTVDAMRIKKGVFSDEDIDKMNIAVNLLKSAQIYIYDSPGINVMDLRAKVRRLKNEIGELGLIVIDYVQIMTGNVYNNKSYNRAQELSDISRALKSLALELKVPIILLSQLNREVENRNDRRPIIADLRESGALEQDADIILLLYRDEYYHKNSKERGIAEINIAKNRNGPTAEMKLAFIADCTRFENLYIEE